MKQTAPSSTKKRVMNVEAEGEGVLETTKPERHDECVDDRRYEEGMNASASVGKKEAMGGGEEEVDEEEE